MVRLEVSDVELIKKFNPGISDLFDEIGELD